MLSFFVLSFFCFTFCLESDLKNKIYSGYQGWFSTSSDGSGLFWKHYNKDGKFAPPSQCEIDIFPDVSEFPKDAQYLTDFKSKNNQTLSVFSSMHPETARIHFKWMNEHNIDGVFLQRFLVEVLHNANFVNTVLNNVQNAAKEYNKKFLIMYDLSGSKLNEWKELYQDFEAKIRPEVINGNENYIKHNNKPVVIIWGIGFNDRYKEEENEYLDKSLELIEYFKRKNCTLVFGVPTYWRELKSDCISNPRFHDVLKKLKEVDGFIQPWNVARFTFNELDAKEKSIWEKDYLWCKENGILYMPIVYPGFSWHHLNPEYPLNQIPREKGNFLWKQFRNLNEIYSKHQEKDRYVYQAMFDEINEGTAIIKALNNSNSPDGFLSWDEGLPSDYYLYLVGKGKDCMNGKLSCKRIPKPDESKGFPFKKDP